MLEETLIVNALRSSLPEIRQRLLKSSWLLFTQTMQDWFAASRATVDDRLMREAVNACMEALLPTDAGPIARQILTNARFAARQDSPIDVTIYGLDNNEHVIMVNRSHPPSHEITLGAIEKLLVQLREMELPQAAPPTSPPASAEPAPDSLGRARPGIARSDAEPKTPRPQDEPEGAASVDTQHINVWIDEQREQPRAPLDLGASYTGCFNVGPRLIGALNEGREREIPLADIPEEGLHTLWIVSARNVRMSQHPNDPDVQVETTEGKVGTTSVAQFTLNIRRVGRTPTRRVMMTPLSVEDSVLTLTIMTDPPADDGPARSSEVYRRIEITLNVQAAAAVPPAEENPGVRNSRTVTHWPATQLGLRPQHEWQTPPETLTVTFIPGQAVVNGTSGGRQVVEVDRSWNPSLAEIEPIIDRLRRALDAVRTRFQKELNAVDESPDDFMRRLRAYYPHDDWSLAAGAADAAARARIDAIASSDQMRRLAAEGNHLYGALFPRKSALREYVQALRNGARLDLYWMKHTGSEWVAHVPWSLMYCAYPPAADKPVDFSAFLGMRLRLAYQSHSSSGRSKSLGSHDAARLGCMLYWGEGDETGTEATLHAAALRTAVGALFVPHANMDRKGELLAYLRQPQPSPTALLYFYCQCNAVSGKAPTLRFGTDNSPASIIEEYEMPREELADQPLIFVNACDSIGAEAYTANMLEQVFADRNCRAFVGTECKVPIRFAGRFALAFMHFLCTPDDNGLPTSAGEAFVQARRLFWDEYRNPGGLFYSYVNQYELFFATDSKVAALTVKPG